MKNKQFWVHGKRLISWLLKENVFEKKKWPWKIPISRPKIFFCAQIARKITSSFYRWPIKGRPSRLNISSSLCSIQEKKTSSERNGKARKRHFTRAPRNTDTCQSKTPRWQHAAGKRKKKKTFRLEKPKQTVTSHHTSLSPARSSSNQQKW